MAASISPVDIRYNDVRYNTGARALHWTLAVLILFNLFTGMFGESLEKVWVSMPLHKATGLLILVLSLVRLGWRLTHVPPPFPSAMQPVLRRFAAFTHGAFYLLMIAVPVTGWIFTSAGKWPLSVYGLFDWPKLALTRTCRSSVRRTRRTRFWVMDLARWWCCMSAPRCFTTSSSRTGRCAGWCDCAPCSAIVFLSYGGSGFAHHNAAKTTPYAQILRTGSDNRRVAACRSRCEWLRLPLHDPGGAGQDQVRRGEEAQNRPRPARPAGGVVP